jgi:site-specific recombinase XerD
MRSPVTIYPPNNPGNICLASYQAWLSEQDLKSNTLRVYYSRVKRFLLFMEYANLGCEYLKEPNSINEVMVLYLNFLKQSKISARSINATINCLNNFSAFLGIQAGELKRARCYNRPAKILTEEEQNKLLLFVKGQSCRDRAIILLFLYAGLRIGDCARLNVEDTLINYGVTLQLNETALSALQQWLEERTQLRAATNTPALWLTDKGKRLSISGISFVINRIGRQMQLNLSAETLRRTCLSNRTI